MKASSKFFALFVFLSLVSIGLAQSPDFEALGKALVQQLAARQFDKVETQFDDQMKAALPLAKLPKVWDSILAQAGEFKSITGAKVMQQQGLIAAFVTCEFERATLDAKIFMDAQGTVKGLFFGPPSGPSESAATEAEWKAPSYAKQDAFHERDTTVRRARRTTPHPATSPKT